MERGISLVPSNALLIQVQAPLLPRSWKHLINDGGGGRTSLWARLSPCPSVPSTFPTLPFLAALSSSCDTVNVEEFEGGWGSGQVLVHCMDFAAPHTPAGGHILLFPALLVSPGTAAGLCHGLAVGTLC